MGHPSLMLQRLALLRQSCSHHHHRSTTTVHYHQPTLKRPDNAPAEPTHTRPHQQHLTTTLRAISTSPISAAAGGEPQGKIGADEDAVAALFDAALGPSAGLNDPRRRRIKDPDADRPKLLTARREALALYREVLRTSNLFVWQDGKGSAWRDRIRASARGEFEAARRETDPELVTRMIVTARDALQRAVEQFRARRAAIIEDEARRADAGVAAPVADRSGSSGGGGGGGKVGNGRSSSADWGAQGVPLVRGGGGGTGGSRGPAGGG